MPIKSLINELPEIVREGNREAATILERLSSANRITLQTNEVVLPAKATSAMRFRDYNDFNESLAGLNRLVYGDNLLVMQALLEGDPSTGMSSLRGKVDLIYIDPPFDSKADYRTKLTLSGGDIEHNEAEVQWRTFSTVEKIPVRKQYSIEAVKTIYTQTPYPSHGGGLEKAFMEWVDNDSEVECWLKVSETRHRFVSIAYMREDGLLATYHPDFVVRTAEGTFIVETKGADKTKDRNVQRKQLAATEWCQKISNSTGERWDYILIDENAFYGLTHAGVTFSDMAIRCRIRMNIIQGELSFE